MESRMSAESRAVQRVPVLLAGSHYDAESVEAASIFLAGLIESTVPGPDKAVMLRRTALQIARLLGLHQCSILERLPEQGTLVLRADVVVRTLRGRYVASYRGQNGLKAARCTRFGF